ncbi:unnamed protein product [Closterium sp. Yama58-4]|nr:unnamed protein product [Closterium sp. Yama58-4]
MGQRQRVAGDNGTEDGGMGQRQGVAGDKGVEDEEERGDNGVDYGKEGGDNGVDGGLEKEERQQRYEEEGHENGKLLEQGEGVIHGDGGGGGSMRHDVMEALEMLKLNLRALEENVETVLHTESSLHPHAFNTSEAFLHLPPGSIETATPAAAGAVAAAAPPPPPPPPPSPAALPAAAELAASQSVATNKAQEPPRKFVRPAVAGPVVIAGMVYNRVFDGDYTRFWALHVWQWLEYHRYAGVNRFYWYDEARSTDEDQDVVLAPYIVAGLVVYHRVREMPFVEGNFTAYLNREFRCKQGAAFNHWVQHYASEVHWAFHTDIDEYFFSPAGTPPGFLRHYLQTLPNTTVQVLVQNMFFLGEPLGSNTDTLLERYTLRMPTSSGRLRTKPIAWLPLAAHRSSDPASARDVFISPHQWPMLENGRSPLVDDGVLRLNHYWGDRAGVVSDSTPDYRMDVTMMTEYGGGLVKDESAKPMGVWLRQRMQVAWAVISAQAVHKERERLRKRVAEVKTRVRQLVALVPQLLKGRGGGGVRRGRGGGRGGGVKERGEGGEGGEGGEESEEAR